MRKWIGTICILLGAALVISALLLLGYNRMEDEKAGEAADTAIAQVQQIIEENRQHNHQTQMEAAAGYSNQQEGDLELEATDLEAADTDSLQSADDYEYIGILTIPALELELPVMSEWDYKRLKIAPCRQYGSAADDDLIIAAHNYDRHFGRLSKLKDGDTITFTDLEGEVYEYAVREIKILEPTATEEVINSEWELLLYTCTYGGKTRVVVGCERLKSPDDQ